jgi:serine/threonine protein kinase/tetratricopeptide (TPR) repeat protein
MYERQLFIAALQIEDPSGRIAYLDEACGSDAGLRQRVEDLLRAFEEAGSFLQEPASADTPADVPRTILSPGDDPGAAPGTTIGPYRLSQAIGEGGMGTVYMAEQTEPVQRKVALKLIKPGLDTRDVIARFEAERQALALMDHPNIAKVLDAGTTGAPSLPHRKGGEGGVALHVDPAPLADRHARADAAGDGTRDQPAGRCPPATITGRPYFVMELVNGTPITTYCDEHRLTPRERLELFIPVCQAVQHAHQKGIIHRDLKPSNVLVAQYDPGAPGVPKVIDFGVAKATGPRLTDRTLFTGFGSIVGTLEYMSPEQAERNELDIDTRSDIYSLGVLLYELLTGTTPLERKRLKEAAILEVLRVIKEEEPPRPSTRLSTTEELPSIAANRSLEPKKLSGLVRGELDWIVMKALEKDRNRRYETANGFAMDVQRYLADEPVAAGPLSTGYRLRKFVRRHKRPVLAVAVIFIVLMGGIVGTTVGLVQARSERDQKDKARQQAEAGFRKAREAVDEYFTRVSETTLLDEPALAPLRRQLLEAARRYYEGFVREHAASADLQGELVAAHFRLSIINYELGPDGDWLTPFRQGVDLMEDLVRKKPGVAALRSLAAGVYRPIGLGLRIERPDEARAAAERACALWEELARAYPDARGFANDLATWYIILGSTYRDRQQPEEALRCHQRACELREQLVAADPGVPRYRAALVNSLANVVEALAQIGRLGEAEQAARRGLELAEGLVSDHPDVSDYLGLLAWLQGVLGNAWQQAGRAKEADQALHQRLDACEKLARALPWVPRYQKEVFEAHAALGDLLWDGDRRAEAAEAYGRAAALEGGLDPHDADAQDSLAWFLAACPDPRYRDPRRAVVLEKKCVERQPQNCSYWCTLGVAHYRAGDWKAAADALTKAARMSDLDFGYNWFFLAMTQWQLGERERARLSFASAGEWMQRHRPNNYQLRRFRAEAEELMGTPQENGESDTNPTPH